MLDYVTRLQRNPVGRVAVHLHLSKLQPNNRREHHIRIAVNAFDSLLKKYEGQLFQFWSNDLVVFTKDASREDIDKVVEKVRYLFSDDPLAASGEAAHVVRGFCTWFNVAQEYPALRTMAEQAARQAEQRRKAQQNQQNRAAGIPDEDMPKPALDPTTLGRMEQVIANMDLSMLVRRQPICAVLPTMAPKIVFNELYVSIPELRRKVMPDVDITGNPWLFQHLTQTLDQRVLSMMPSVEAGIAISSSVNINVSTLLSPQFLTFDSKLRAVTQKTVVFELQPADIFRDMGAFMFARDFVRDRGYRLCLDGLNHLSYPMIQRSQLGFDLEKIVWANDLAHDGHDPRRERFREAVRAAGGAKVILCRCDGAEAVEFGQSLGITLYQGRYIDRLLTGAVGADTGGRAAG
jgi:EAL domain-containing protein (putative c-di-GMP-specific phosphodiesterase class I)